MSRHILIVDDDHATLRLIELGLRSEGFELTTVPNAAEALRVLSEREVRVVLTDINMPRMNGVELCNHIAMAHPDVPVIVITAFGSMESAVSAMRSGAFDFLTKPFEIEALTLAVRRALEHHELRAEVRRLRLAVGAGEPIHDLIGASPSMAELRSLLARVAASDATVLVTGETGTGKEVVARAIHARSRRAPGPFVAMNCAAVPEALLESELVGHVRGAFTDARVSRTGLLVSASGGTLFLDEIGDLPLGLQPKLLRIVEERQVRPIGSNTEISFDTRIIAATHRDLESAIEDGRFREDLYYRLNVLTVSMPPLRSRGADVLLLGQHFIRQFARTAGKAVQGTSGPAAAALLNYPWPGNVRELRNAMERAVALTAYDSISPEDLPEKIRSYQSRHVIVAGDDLSELVPLEEVEKRYILRVLEAAGGNKSVAAQKLGVNRKTLYRKLAEYGVLDA